MRALHPPLPLTQVSPADLPSRGSPTAVQVGREHVAPGTRVTQTDIARAAGVHNATVSLALRRSPLIPEATRERIQAIARSLGYTPDPALRALAAYRNRHSAARRAETLVYLTDGEPGGDSRESAAQTAHAASARRKAEELGFQFKPVCLGETGLNLRRLDRMLEHAGIRCAILASPPWSGTDWSALNWSRLCAVAIGDASPLTPRLHHVTIDDGAIMRLALQRVRRAGYRHIGLALTRPQDQFDERAWSAAFLAEQYRAGIRDPLPVLYLPDEPASDGGTLLRWFRACQPEVILGLSPTFPHQLRLAGLGVPEEVAYADLSLQDTYQTIAGVRDHRTRVGELAVEMLATQLAQNQFGLPAIPTVTCVGGTWCDGASLPVRRLPDDEMERSTPVTLPRNLVA